MLRSGVSGGLSHSSSSSGIFFQADGHSHTLSNSHLSSSFGNSSNSVPRSHLGPFSGDVSNVVLSSGPSVGASSLVTDANSGLSGGGPYLQRSASINTESHTRLPASPLSFSSNNMSLSGSSVMDGSSVIQQNSNQDSSSQQLPPHGQQQQGASSVTSRMGQFSLPSGPGGSISLLQDTNNMSHLQKKPRVDMIQEDIMQQHVVQQFLQRQDSMQNPQLQALIQQQRLRQEQQQILQAMPPVQRAHLLQQQQQQQLQLRQQIQQQAIQPASSVKRPNDSGVCSRRLMQYLYHQRQRPAENTIAYWRKFVSEYFSPRAKKRWCLSSYENVGHHSLGVFPQTTKDAWQCDICGSKSGKGFEATFEVLPRLNEIKFGSGVIDELLFLDFPRECRFPTGIMMLEYSKAVQESVYEQLRVVREGQLRIVFASDLKILSWEFCARRHEELLSRKLVSPQVNQLLHVAQKCQKTIMESGSEGVSQQDLQTNSNMVVTAGRQLARTLELSSLNDLGFSKRYVRCLQISEVVNSMKDLMNFCQEPKAGPIDGLKNYPRHAASANLQTPKMHEMEQLANIQGLMTYHPGLNVSMSNSNPQMAVRGGALNSPAQSTSTLANYQNILMRQNSMNSNSNSLQLERSSSFNNSNQNPSPTAFQGPTGLVTQTLSVRDYVNSQFLNQHQSPRHSISGGDGVNRNPSMQHPMMQQMMQNVNNNNNIGGRNGNENVTRSGPVIVGASVAGCTPSRSSSFKAGSNNDSSAAGGGNNSVVNEKASDFPNNLHLPDDMAHDIAREFSENGFFSSDFDDNLDFGWKA